MDSAPSDGTAIPSFYLGNDDTKALECTYLHDKEVQCSVGELVDFTTASQYQIYYLNTELDTLLYTGVTINSIVTETVDITILSLKFSDGTTVNEMKLPSILLVADKDPGDVSEVKIGEDDNLFVFTCNVVSTDITCTTDNTIVAGTYKIQEITGDADTYSFDQANTIQYIEPIITRTEAYTYQEVSSNLADFSIELVSNDTTTPNFYLGKDDQKELSCTGSNPLICTVPEATQELREHIRFTIKQRMVGLSQQELKFQPEHQGMSLLGVLK